MRVICWPADEGGCGSNRILWPAAALSAQGADVHVDWEGPRIMWSRRWDGDVPPPDAAVVGVERPDADVVVFQRPARRWWTDVIPYLQARGVRVVVDVDDDFSHIPPENKAAGALGPHLRPWFNWEWIGKACAAADLVTVTTLALARRYGRHGRVAVLPNLVPASYLDVEGFRDGRTVGWTGNVETHPHDLETTGGTVQGALDRHGWRFKVVGTGNGVQERLRLAHTPEGTGWRPIEDYPGLYASLDVAIVPLCRSVFNDAKSALKMMEAAALGVPVVGSPTPDNQRLHRLGVGLLAAKPCDWARQLDRLLGSGDLRAELADAGRRVMRPLTYEQRCGDWLQAWSTRALTHAA